MEFEDELISLINKYSKENDSDTPDFILAGYIEYCLLAFTSATKLRDKWHGFKPFANNRADLKRTGNENKSVPGRRGMNHYMIGDGLYCQRCGAYFIGTHYCPNQISYPPAWPSYVYNPPKCDHCYCQDGKENHKKCCKCANELHKDFVGMLRP